MSREHPRVVSRDPEGREQLGAAVALLCDVLAYTLQAEALGRMPRGLFSILTSTEPAVGAILGLLALGQRITLVQWAGIVAVVAASAGATRAHARKLESLADGLPLVQAGEHVPEHVVDQRECVGAGDVLVLGEIGGREAEVLGEVKHGKGGCLAQPLQPGLG